MSVRVDQQHGEEAAGRDQGRPDHGTDVTRLSAVAHLGRLRLPQSPAVATLRRPWRQPSTGGHHQSQGIVLYQWNRRRWSRRYRGRGRQVPHQQQQQQQQ